MSQQKKLSDKFKRVLRCKKGELYIDSAISMVMLVMVIAVALNVFQFFTLKINMEHITKELIYVATMHGTTKDNPGSPVGDRLAEIETELGMDVNVTWSAPDGYFNGSDESVQYGDKIVVTVSYDVELTGVGAEALSGPVTATRSGLSEKYWK